MLNFHICDSDDNASSQKQIFRPLPLHENHSRQCKWKDTSPISYSVTDMQGIVEKHLNERKVQFRSDSLVAAAVVAS